MTDSFIEARHHLFEQQYRVGAGKGRQMLQRVVQSHLFCTLFFEGLPMSFNSLLLPERGPDDSLLLDLPPSFPSRVASGSEVSVLFRLDGVICGFHSRLLDRGSDHLRLEDVDTLFEMQRRQRFRVPPTIEDPDQISIERRGAVVVSGTIQDISTGGLRVLSRIPGDIPFSVGEILPRVSFQLRNSSALDIPAHVRFIDSQTQRGVALIIGMEFGQLPASHQEQIAQYVQTRDREILKSLGGGLPGSGLGRPETLSSRLKKWWAGA